jgi:pimeloyl-ACP methyl ester carboxylesterase
VTQPYLLVEPSGAPVASVILFTGGNGAIGFKDPGPFPRGGNFLVRNRQAFARHGLLTAVIDTPSDHAGGLGLSRITEDHARDVAAVIAALRQTAPVPVWVIGTSRGTVSAVNAAARLRAHAPDGLVITSSVTRSSRPGIATVYAAGLDDVRIPTLVVHHEHDACVGTPAADARPLFARVRAPRRELLLFDGGAGGGSGNAACGPFAAHGYFGIDAEVVKAIADWIKATPAR